MMYLQPNNFHFAHKESSVLMVKKGKRLDDPNSGFYTLPGGKLKNMEMGLSDKGRLECAVRETKEETGIIPLYPTLRGVILFDNSERVFSDWRKPEDFLVYMFEASHYSGELKETDEGTPLWIPENEIPMLPKNPGDDRMYSWLRNGNKFMGLIKIKDKDEIIEQKTFVDYF